MAKNRRPRSPGSFRFDPDIYGGIETKREGGPLIYIGAPYHQDFAQIHLTPKQLIKLAPWIARAAAWAKGQL